MSEHTYNISLKWTGNTGEGTKDYRSYGRSHQFSIKGKPNLTVSADPMFKGDPALHNPEELLVMALSSCHMLSYLHLCTTKKIVVKEYVDEFSGVLVLDASGSGHFKEVTLHPKVVITDAAQLTEAENLHHLAHEKCFIANSVNFPVLIKPSIQIA